MKIFTKRIFLALAVLLFAGLAAGCNNNADNDKDNDLPYDDELNPERYGWYEMSYSNGTASDWYYISPANGGFHKITRAGKTQEFTGVAFDAVKDFTYGYLNYIAENSDNMTFKKSGFPVWASEKPPEADWYYTIRTTTRFVVRFYYINADGFVERCGNLSEEFKGSELQSLQDRFNYDYLKWLYKDSDSVNFEPVPSSYSKPDWARHS